MRQKTMLACALVRPAAVLVLDEPVVGLDPPSQALLRDAARRACAGRGGGAAHHAPDSPGPTASPTAPSCSTRARSPTRAPGPRSASGRRHAGGRRPSRPPARRRAGLVACAPPAAEPRATTRHRVHDDDRRRPSSAPLRTGRPARRSRRCCRRSGSSASDRRRRWWHSCLWLAGAPFRVPSSSRCPTSPSCSARRCRVAAWPRGDSCSPSRAAQAPERCSPPC